MILSHDAYGGSPMLRSHRSILAAALVSIAPASAVRAEEQAASGSAKEQIKAGFKEAGRAIGRGATAVGHLFRDGAKETWRATKPAREDVKDAGREVGHASAKVGREIGQASAEAGREIGRASAEAGRNVGEAAKDAGRNVKQAVKGEDGGGED